MFINLIGWIGTILLSSAGLPQLYKTLKDGHALGIHLYYLLFIFFGLISMIIYVMLTNHSIQLLFSYGFQLIVFSILLYKKKFPNKNKVILQ